jgi:tripartite-type tricarboxylate transporter receptor subunit TctC
MKRREFLTTLGALAILPEFAWAQAYPNKPIRLINPFPPGGTTEILGRLIGQGMTQSMGQTIVLDTRSGAGGNIGLEATARSAPDGYTIAMYPISSVMAPAVYKNLAYDPLKDLVPVALVGKMPSLLCVHPSRPIHSVSDLLKLAKESPGKINYASAGIGTSPHLFTELFAHMSGIKITHVPYKGAGPALVDQIAGQVDIGFQTATAALPYVQQGKLRAIATTTLERFAPLPNVPSVADSGVPGFEASAWFGVVAPANTPKDIIDRLNSEIMKSINLPETKKRLDDLGVVTSNNSAEDFGKFMRSEAVKWAEVVKIANVKAE